MDFRGVRWQQKKKAGGRVTEMVRAYVFKESKMEGMGLLRRKQLNVSGETGLVAGLPIKDEHNIFDKNKRERLETVLLKWEGHDV